VAHDIGVERRLAQETTVLESTHTLPDGRVIKLGRERFEAPEALFDPSLIDVESRGMGHMVFDMIQWAAVWHAFSISDEAGVSYLGRIESSRLPLDARRGTSAPRRAPRHA